MKKKNTAALIVHTKGLDALHRYFAKYRENYMTKKMKDDTLRKLFCWSPPAVMSDFTITSHSEAAGSIDGFCIVATFLPEMLLNRHEEVISKIEAALIESEKRGAAVASLAAFTSIADGRQGELVSRVAKSMAVTNGSTFTSAMAIEGIRKMCRILDINIGAANMAIIGATGSIGRTCSRYFMGKTARLTLTGRKFEKLEKLFGGYLEQYSNLFLTDDNNGAVADADLVISVTSSIQSIFKSEAFKSGAVICDVGFPKNIAQACNDRDDIIVYSGGLARIPGDIEHLDVMGLPANNICYGCMSEGILLALTERLDLCTVGLDDIPLRNVDILTDMGYEHGFDVAPYFNDYKYYCAEDFDRVKRAREALASSACV